MVPRIESSIDRLGSIIKQQAGAQEPLFRPGCSEADVARMETTLDVRLPEAYKTLLRRANGQQTRAKLAFPPDRLAFLGADEVLALWAETNEYADNEFFDEFESDDKVRAILFHPGRIPIAHYEMGRSFLWLDMVPGPNGRAGQLVFNVTESGCVVLEDSIEALLQRYTDLVESGLIGVNQEPSPQDVIEYEIKASGRYIDYDLYVELREGLTA